MSILDTILDHKRQVEVPERRQRMPLDTVRRAAEVAPLPRDFAAALRRADGHVALIAEVKRASPSKGVFIKGEFKPAEIAQTYAANGASAISMLTDELFFHGHLDFLTATKPTIDIPILRKDFIVDAYQLYEARAAGADAALLIVSALDDVELRDLHQLALALKLTPLVEVHDEAEMTRALSLGATVIGVNNRDLRTFKVDIETTGRCAALLNTTNTNARSRITLVSESGIFTPADVARVAALGAQAILVGESLITSPNMAEQVRQLASVPCTADTARPAQPQSQPSS